MKTKIAFILAFVLMLVISIGYFLMHKDKDINRNISHQQKTYIALGDSVAAGVGLPTPSDSSACNRSDESYPYLIAKMNSFRLFNFACSGATTTDGIINGQNVNNLLLPAQLSQLTSNEKPSLITLTIGANDINWVSLIQKCYSAACGDTSDNESINTGLVNVAANLKSILDNIDSIYNTDKPHVAVTGYYHIFTSEEFADCSERAGIDSDELQWITKKIDELNSTINKTVVVYTSATYVPIDFSGHEICSHDPWIQGIDDRAPFHPTERGQAEFANKIKDAVESL